MTNPMIPALAFIGLVFAFAAGSRILLRAALVLGFLLDELAGRRARLASATAHPIAQPAAA
jgi:hypothetical protein